MTDLLERLIEEAARRGVAEKERDTAILAAEAAAKSVSQITEELDRVRLELVRINGDLHESRNNEQQVIFCLRDLVDALGNYAVKRPPKAAIEQAHRMIQLARERLDRWCPF